MYQRSLCAVSKSAFIYNDNFYSVFTAIYMDIYYVYVHNEL